MEFIDLNKQYQRIKVEVDNAISNVLNHGQYILGPEVANLESSLSQYLGVKHSIGCASGTDALLIALMALEIGPGDEVIIPDFTFFATAEVVSLLGATPIFADINPDTYNMCLDDVSKKITNKTKAIIPVSLYGLAYDISSLQNISHDISIIEDAAQSFGAVTRGVKSCTQATISCTSFFPSKPLGGYGDGGALFTNSDELNEKIRIILKHGQSERYVHTHIGVNGRLDTIQAAILIEKLKIFPDELNSRQVVADRYRSNLESTFKLQNIGNNTSAYAQFTIEVDNRDAVIKFLKDHGIPSAVHYPVPLSKQPVYSKLSSAYNNVNTINASNRVISLPFHPYLTEESIDKVCNLLLRFKS
ncbi:DegT/DnrJ/EryC1/StrS aminotransferase family protein [Bacteriovorax sp. Seq25_V]|nr:DegT/DnrJ/EryC1/StrS aminotransferase family protein [Bacteriovorax sp. Seq25_V]EQC43238.1 DegT/DnrJ/EryC1/StrS aminotransferase family protein [Bacteriovorax sp. Seq25_V]